MSARALVCTGVYDQHTDVQLDDAGRYPAELVHRGQRYVHNPAGRQPTGVPRYERPGAVTQPALPARGEQGRLF